MVQTGITRLRHLRLYRTAWFVALWCLLAGSPTAWAASYNVHAAVPYPVPSQAAVFDSSLDGTTVQTALVTLTGTCQTLTPDSVVSIERSGSSLGSAACISGGFSVQVTLRSGTNRLIARTANVSTVYGPDSSPITITLDLPAPPPPPISGGGSGTGGSTSSGNTPSTPAEQNTEANAGVRADLQITPTKAFSTLEQDKTIKLAVHVSGGDHPYEVTLNWGDGSAETHGVAGAGRYTFTHVYAVLADYQVLGQVRDHLGRLNQFNYAVVSYKSTKPVPAEVDTTGNLVVPKSERWHKILPYALGTVSAVVLINVGYWVGNHHLVKRATRRASRKRRKGKKR